MSESTSTFGSGLHDTSLPNNAISLNSGIVVYGIIIKRPYRHSDSPADQDEYNDRLDLLEHEKQIYRRLQGCEGVVPFLDLSGPAILLPLFPEGTLDRYLKRNNVRPTTRADQLKWVKRMVGTLARMHDRRVLFVDVASRNMLIRPDGSIVFCDFGASSIFPLETDIWSVQECGFSFATDVCELGAVTYEVVHNGARQIADFDRTADECGGWPSRDKLPAINTDDVFLGSVIEACWTKGRFRTTHELCQRLEEEDFHTNEAGVGGDLVSG
ncbi:hypothetical protein ABEF93_006412 [Exophiala dermatitidis]